jgi:protein phosphatase
MRLKIPKLSLVVLIGASGSGKSTFARRHFKPTEILSSDACRGMISDDENDQTATSHAFEILHTIAAKRLELGKLTVIDATNVQPEARAPLVHLARKYHCLPAAIVLDLPESLCHERNRDRDDRNFGPHVVRQQRSQLRRSLRNLKREGFRHVFVLDSVAAVESVTVERVPLWNDRTHEHGPWGSRASRDLSAASHCGACMSASSAYWRLRASRSIRGYRVTTKHTNHPARPSCARPQPTQNHEIRETG